MGILATFDRNIRANMYRDREDKLAAWLRGDDADEPSDSGVSVNQRNAMQMAVVWQCVNWRAKMYGHLPHKLFESVEILGRRAQREASSHPLFPLIHTAPNPTLTSAAWFGLISADLHVDGNSYAWQERGSATGRIRNLWRFCPDMMRLDQKGNGPIDYYARRADGTEQHFSAHEILHIRGLGFDGVRGYSPIALMRQELGWALATRRFSSKFYANAFRPSGLIFSTTVTKEPEKSKMLAALKAAGKDGGLALIEGGALDYKPLMIPQNDQQFLETMQFQDERIAGIMEVYAQEIGIMRHMTNSNVEQMTISSVTRNLVPFATGVEQWMNLQLLSDAPSSGRGGGTERDRFFIQSNFHALLRGDTAAQTAHLIAMRDRGIYDGNDCADYLGLPPFEGGEIRVINGANVPLEDLKEIAAQRSAPPAPADPNQDDPEPDEPAKDPATATALGQMFSHVFRDAVGRCLKRTKDRERAVVTIFAPVLDSIRAVTNSAADDAFLLDYLSALGKRAVTWDDAQADSISTDELNRLIEALIERQS